MEFSKEKLNELAGEFQFKLVVLYGSAAASQMNKFSDIDIGILLNDDKALENFQNMSFFAKLENELSKIFAEASREIDLSILNFASPLLKFQVKAMKENQDIRKFYDFERDYIRDYLKGDRENDRTKVNPPQVK
ncbi:MAG: nucleotidyltransferase family protein [Halarsenatibacteraceae bacterium]